MQLATLKDGSLAVIRDGRRYDISKCLDSGASMVDLITIYQAEKNALENCISAQDGTRFADDVLAAPVLKPSKIWGAAGNYRRGSGSLDSAGGRGEARTATPDELLETIFLKPSSAVIGPGESVVIPGNAQTVFPELELCVVIGRECRDVPVDQALDAVFGYSIILDVTARGYGSGKNLVATRCVRKGFNTFAPVGPWIVTRDEIADPQNLTMKLWVNDQLRQSASTGGMINGVARLVSYLSQVGTLFPGDLIASGNPDAPDFQEQLAGGDVLIAEIEGIGRLRLGVEKE